jgi:hypothetical protein
LGGIDGLRRTEALVMSNELLEKNIKKNLARAQPVPHKQKLQATSQPQQSRLTKKQLVNSVKGVLKKGHTHKELAKASGMSERKIELLAKMQKRKK